MPQMSIKFDIFLLLSQIFKLYYQLIMDNLNGVLMWAIEQCCDIIFSSSSEDSADDSDEYEVLVQCIETKIAIPRLQNYVETIVPQFNDGQFKSNKF